MSKARRAEPVLQFNGVSVVGNLKNFLEEFTYDDVASGASDTISVGLYNADMIWLKAYLPKKGDRIVAKLLLHDWSKEGDEQSLECGDFLLDEMKMSGGPLAVSLGGISLPTDSSIKTTNRTCRRSLVQAKV